MRQVLWHHPGHTVLRGTVDSAAVLAVAVAPLGSTVLRRRARHLMRRAVSRWRAELDRVSSQPTALNLCCWELRTDLLARPVICRFRRDATPAMRAATVPSGAVGRKGSEWLGQPATPATDLCGATLRHRPATLALHGRGMGTGAAARNNALHQCGGGHDGRRATDALAEPAIRPVPTGSAAWQSVEDDQVAEVSTGQISGVSHAPNIWRSSIMHITPRSSAYRSQRLTPPSPVCLSSMAARELVALRERWHCATRDVDLLPADIDLQRRRRA